MVSRLGGAAPGTLHRGIRGFLEVAGFLISLLDLDEEIKRYPKTSLNAAAERPF